MKIICKHDKPGACKKCKYQSTCSLLKPTTENHSMLQKEINYLRQQLNKTHQNLQEYERIFQDIRNHKYSTPVNVYGSIKYAPKTNVYGVFIKKPEHVIYGWNLSTLTNKQKKLLEKIRLLNRKELNMRKILEKNSKGGIHLWYLMICLIWN